MHYANAIGIGTALVLAAACQTRPSRSAAADEAPSQRVAQQAPAQQAPAQDAPAQDAPARPAESPVVAQFADIVNEACACGGDDSCIDKASTRMAELTERHAGFAESLPEPAKSRHAELEKRYDGCISSRGASVVSDMTILVAKACACKDTPCLDAVTAEVKTLGQKYRNLGTDITAEQGNQLTALARKYADCEKAINAE